MSTLAWFRADLRVTDNAALAAACADSDAVAGVFLVADGEWTHHDWGPRRQRFVWEHALALREALALRGIPLHILHAPRFTDAPAALAALAARLQVRRVHAQTEYGVDERARDAAVLAALAARGIGLELHHALTLLPPGSVLTREGAPFRVFTPFKRSWIQLARTRSLACRPLSPPREPVQPPPLPAWQPQGAPADPARWPIGEQAAADRLRDFVGARIDRYRAERDVPALDATSRLSPYLACGALSVRECFAAALAHNDGEWDSGSEGVQCWLSELVWREFYTHVLVAFPRVSRNRAFRPATESIPWRAPGEELRRWQEGCTGFPLLDAAQRQLLAEGWMHNRLRMLSSMFLSKYLLIDWRRGERHFMHELLDGDLAANNGGWQWSASTGTDAAPYFRTLCPVRQAERFDPAGDFVRRYVPELARCSSRSLQRPGDPALLAAGYPAPMVELRSARNRALDAFRACAADALAT